MSKDQSITSLLPLHYEGQRVRTHIDSTGMVWSVVHDIADLLGYRSVSDAIRILDEDEKGLQIVHTPGGPQQMVITNVSGLYHLIFLSRRHEAKKFRRWVTDDVLPTLMRTGTFTLPTAHSTPLKPAVLTSAGYLPPRQQPAREHAEVSWHLLAVFCLLRDHDEWLSNHEIAHRTGIALRTARAHTLYLLQLGMIERQECFPRHLHHFASHAERRNAEVFSRLTHMADVMQARQQY